MAEVYPIATVSLTQPWASLMAAGFKHVETRGWAPRYRGRIAIHASARYPADCRHYANGRVVTSVMGPHYVYPLGAVLAIGTLVRCVRTESIVDTLSATERKFGDYSNGRWAWIFEGVEPLPEPIPARGALNIWRWPPPVEDPPAAAAGVRVR